MKESESVELKRSLAELKNGLNLRIRTTDKATDKKLSATTIHSKPGIAFESVSGVAPPATPQVTRPESRLEFEVKDIL